MPTPIMVYGAVTVYNQRLTWKEARIDEEKKKWQIRPKMPENKQCVLGAKRIESRRRDKIGKIDKIIPKY